MSTQPTTSLLPADLPQMILRSTLTSPYGRKVRIAAINLGIAEQFSLRPADTSDPDDDLRIQNPLGKMPYLTVGSDILFDSRVILEFLDELMGGGALLPRSGIGRYKLLTKAALADGIIDASLLLTYEWRFRSEAQRSERWRDHQMGKVERGLAALANDLPNPSQTDVATISLACALGYLDWRKHLDWRHDFPVLQAWLDAYSAAEPAFEMTRKPE